MASPSSPPSSRSPSPRTARRASGLQTSATGRPPAEARERAIPREMDAIQRGMEIVDLVNEGYVADLRAFDAKLRTMGSGLVKALEEGRKMAARLGQVSSGSHSDAVIQAAAEWSRSLDGYSLLHLAAEGGHFEICVYLVDQIHMDINSIGLEGNTPLMSAIAGSYPTPTVNALLSRGAALNVANNKNLTALHMAVIRDLFEVAHLLLSSGADIDPLSDLGTPLQIAVQKCTPELVGLLVTRGANKTIKGRNGHTLLHLAIMHGNYETASSLLTKRIAQVDDICQDGTALHIAARSGNVEMVTLLIEYNAIDNIADMDGLTPIEVAASRGERECVQYLLEYTTRLDKYNDWSVDDILEHFRTEKLKQHVQEDPALKKEDCGATVSTEAMKAFTFEPTLLQESDESIEELMRQMRLHYGGSARNDKS